MSKRRTARGGGRGRAGGRATGRSAAAQKQFKTSVKEARSKGIDTRGQTRKENEALEKKQRDQDKQANIKDDGILAGIGFRGQEVDRTVKKEQYDDPRKHKLRNQFDYLADKYYGGSKEDFAKTSQGQVLLGYLSGVSADRGGGRGGDTQALQQGLQGTDLAGRNIGPQFSATQGSATQRARINPITAFDIRNLNIPQVRQNFTTNGIEDTAAFRRFNEALQVAAPDAYGKARPFSSGQGIGTLIEQGAGFVPGLGLTSRFIGGLLPQGATGGLTPDEYLDQDLFKNLPMDERVDTGGVNDVAQSIINNQVPVLPPKDEVVALRPEDMVLPNFGIEDPLIRAGLLRGGVTEVLPGFDLNDTLRLLANRGIFSPTTVT